MSQLAHHFEMSGLIGETSAYIHHFAHDHHLSLHHKMLSSSEQSSQADPSGFPEQVCRVTTSRRHPDAILTPGHSISSEDVDPARSQARSRKSTKHSKYKRTISYGRITEEQKAQHARVNTGMNSIDSAIDLPEDKPLDIREMEGRPSKDTNESIGQQTDGSSFLQEEYTPITPVTPDTPVSHHDDSLRKKNFFSRFKKD